MKYRILFPFLITVILCQSCIKEPHPSWETEMLAPLLSSRLSFSNLVDDTLLNVDQDNFVSIIYEKTLYKIKVDSIVDFPDTLSKFLYQIPVSGTINPGTQFVNNTENKKFTFGNAEIRFIRVKKGKIHFKALNTIDEKILLKYKIISATKDGIPFEIEKLIPAGFPNTAFDESYYDISGYNIDMTGTNGGMVNILIISTQIEVDPAGNPVYVTQSDSMQINITLEDLEIEYVKGYLGSDNISI